MTSSITIDVDRASPTFGTIIHRLDLGSKGNETHHWGFTDDRTRIWAGGLFSSRIWILDVATDPAAPRIETGPGGRAASRPACRARTPTTPCPGRMLLTFLGAEGGGLPAGMAEFTNDGRFIRRIDQPEEAPYGYDVAVQPKLNRMVSSSFTPYRNYSKPFAEMGLDDFGDELVVWDLKERRPIQVGRGRQGPAGGPLVARPRERLRLHQLRPRRFHLPVQGQG